MKEKTVAVAAIRSALVRRFASPEPHVLIACMPKSASSFVTAAVAALPGMRQLPISSSGTSRREHVLDQVMLMRHHHKAYVDQLHIRFDKKTASMMDRYNVKPVVLVRNLFDVVASLRDHIKSSDVIGPLAYFTQDQRSLPDSVLEMMIADLVMPWYVNFYVSWQDCKKYLTIDYNMVRQDPENVLRQICLFTGIYALPEGRAAAMASAKAASPRLNKGISGRGATINKDAISHIKKLCSYYPNVNFTRVGVTNEMRQ